MSFGLLTEEGVFLMYIFLLHSSLPKISHKECPKKEGMLVKFLKENYITLTNIEIVFSTLIPRKE
jgi:hypothetical protein